MNDYVYIILYYMLRLKEVVHCALSVFRKPIPFAKIELYNKKWKIKVKNKSEEKRAFSYEWFQENISLFC